MSERAIVVSISVRVDPPLAEEASDEVFDHPDLFAAATRFPECTTPVKCKPVPLSAPPASTRCLMVCGSDSSRPSQKASEMNEQTSGCIRQVFARKSPGPFAMVSRPSSTCSSTDRPGPGGCTPCDGCASC